MHMYKLNMNTHACKTTRLCFIAFFMHGGFTNVHVQHVLYMYVHIYIYAYIYIDQCTNTLKYRSMCHVLGVFSCINKHIYTNIHV